MVNDMSNVTGVRLGIVFIIRASFDWIDNVADVVLEYRDCSHRQTWVLHTISHDVSCCLKPHPAHIGYFVPLIKIADFLRAGVEVSVGIPSNRTHVFIVCV